MAIDDDQRGPGSRAFGLIALLAVGAACCLVFGYWAFVYDGYVEDPGMEPVNSWLQGVAAFVIAGLLITLAVAKARPNLGDRHLVGVVIFLAAALTLAAFGALEAGNR